MRITKVDLRGFKGQDRTVELGELTLLTGPNGLGKSAVLEGLRYALSGEVPAGKAFDVVALYFPDRGGSVTVTDSGGNWVRRGIIRDYEKAKVSEEFEQEGDVEWIANEALLDMKDFLSRSANRRREFVLDLVGAGEEPSESDVHARLAADYAREIGGAGADVSILDGRRDDLPDDLQVLAGRWNALWGVLATYLKTGDRSGSAVFQRLTDAARERKNTARTNAKDARSAIRELEAAAKGARAAAADLGRCRKDAAATAEALVRAREAAAAREEVRKELEAAGRELGELRGRLAAADEAIGKLADPGPRPEPPGDDGLVTKYRAEWQATAEDETDGREALARASQLGTDLAAAEAALEVARRDLDALEGEPVGKAVAVVARIRGFEMTQPQNQRLTVVLELCDLVDELAVGWKSRKARAEERVATAGARADELRGIHAEALKAAPSVDEHEALMSRRRELFLKAEVAERTARERSAAHLAALDQWESKSRSADAVRADRKTVCERMRSCEQRQEDLTDRLAGMADPDVQAAFKAAGDAREALQKAEEAAGAVKAYEDARSRAEREKVDEKAWKAAEASCRRARETYVGDVVRPLVDDVAALLRAAGRSERVYLTLENDRGKPVFDLGWSAGQSRRSLSALSGGEAVLFTAALALTIARRAGGRRVLLIEADPLDEDNLTALLTAIAKMEIELDACLVATSTDFGAKVGWKVIRYEREEVTA